MKPSMSGTLSAADKSALSKASFKYKHNSEILKANDREKQTKLARNPTAPEMSQPTKTSPRIFNISADIKPSIKVHLSDLTTPRAHSVPIEPSNALASNDFFYFNEKRNTEAPLSRDDNMANTYYNKYIPGNVMNQYTLTKPPLSAYVHDSSKRITWQHENSDSLGNTSNSKKTKKRSARSPKLAVSTSVDSSLDTSAATETVDDLLDLLSNLSKRNDSNLSFVHVTPRCNVQDVKRYDFYDLTFIEVPGFASGMVWTRGSQSNKSLKPNQIMQLSSEGLLCEENFDELIHKVTDTTGDFIPMSRFLHERKVHSQLRSFKVFGLFAEAKYFGGWRRYIKQRKFSLISKELLKNTFFCSTDFVSVVSRITSTCFRLEDETELFYFHTQGCMNIMDYMTLQKNHLPTIIGMLNAKIDSLGNYLMEQFRLVSGAHDYDNDHVPESFLEARTGQRIVTESREKIIKLFWLASYRVDSAICVILNRFWDRNRLLLGGIISVNTSNVKFPMGYWNLDVVASTSSNRNDDANPLHVTISNQQQKLGSYLSVDLKICDQNYQPVDFHDAANIHTKYTIRIIPSRSELGSTMSMLTDALLLAVESIPILKYHSFASDTKPKNANKFYRCYVIEGARIFSATLKHVYHDAQNVIKIGKLQDYLLKLQRLNHGVIADRLSGAASIKKLRDVFENYESVDGIDVAFANLKYCDREMDNIQNMVVQVGDFMAHITDLKIRNGLVIYYTSIASQLHDLYYLQQQYSYMQSLPVVISRYTALIELQRDVVNVASQLVSKLSHVDMTPTSIDSTNDNAMNYVFQLFERLRNFSFLLNGYNLERILCEKVYQIVKNTSLKTINAIRGNRKFKFTPSDPSSQYKSSNDLHEKMMGIMKSAKVVFGSYILVIRKHLVNKKEEYRIILKQSATDIQRYYKSCASDCTTLCSDKIAGDIKLKLRSELLEIEKLGEQLKRFKEDIYYFVKIQEFLSESHLTIGSAIVLNNNEVERFEELTNQLELFKMTYGLWYFTTEILSLNTKTKALKVGDEAGIIHSIHKFQELSKVYEDVKGWFLHAGHNLLEIDAVGVECNKCLAHLELLVSLNNPSFNTSNGAMQRMNTEILSSLGYQLRIADAAMEMVPINKNAMQQQGSKFSEITVSDLFIMKANTKLTEMKQFYCHLAAEDYIYAAVDKLDGELKQLTAEFKGVEWFAGESSEIIIKFSNFDEINHQLHSYQQVLVVLNLLLKQFYSSKCCAKMNEFYEYLNSSQYLIQLDSLNHKCFQLLHYMKYSNPSEQDRSMDTAKAYQSITDQIKLVTTIVEQKGNNIFRAADAIKKYGLKLTSLESSLSSILDEMHVTVRSLLDECPRLSLLAYHKLHLLFRAHRFGPSTFKNVIGLCIHELHPYIGALHYEDSLCVGFSCIDNIEVLRFITPVSLTTTLPKMMNEFEQGIKELLTASCDKNSVYRIQGLRALVVGTPTWRILDSLNCIFSLRLAKLLAVDSIPNQVVYLLNQVWFHEDIQCCLGEIIGSLILARPTLADEKKLFRKKWKNSLKLLKISIENNIEMLQNSLNTHQSGRHGSFLKKNRVRLSSLLLLERSFLDTVNDIMIFSSLDDAICSWNDRYQLIFNYCKEDRINNSPFEVKLGLMRVIYGLEYQGSTVRVIPTTHRDVVMQKVLGASLVKKVSILMNHPHKIRDSNSNAAVTPYDIANALGRMCIKLPFPATSATIKLFISRLLYLDAIGNFHITPAMYASGLNTIYEEFDQAMTAIDIKNDAYFQRYLKCYGENASFNFSSRTQVTVDRRKNNLNDLRSRLELYQKRKVFHNIVMVGNAFNLADTSIHDSFSIINTSRILVIDSFGPLLQSAGFTHWANITSSFLHIINDSFKPIRDFLSTNRVLQDVVNDARAFLSLMTFNSQASSGIKESYPIERACFIRALLNYLHKFGQNIPNSSIKDLRSFSKCVLQHFEETQQSVEMQTLEFSSNTKKKLLQAAMQLGYVAENGFIRNCGIALELMTSRAPVIAIVGPSGVGKTSIINTAYTIFKSAIGAPKPTDHLLESDHSIITGYSLLGTDRAIRIIYRFMMRYCHKRSNDSCGKCTRHVVYHASLTFPSLIGSYNENGDWFDGYLLRLLKYIDYYIYEPGIYNTPEMSASQAIIVLDGPIAFHLENIFSSLSNAYTIASHTRALCLPSGEMYCINPRVKLIVETNDITQASPSFLSHFPSLSIDDSAASPQLVVTKLLKVWLSSMTKSLCTHSYWIPIFEEVQSLLLQSQFVTDSLFYDANQCNLSVASTVSRISTFIRYLENLFEECNKFAIEESDVVDKVPRLGKVGCTKLLARARLSLTYATLWGFGGNLNSVERKVYDAVLRDNVSNYIDHHIEFPDISLFETVLDLQKVSFVAATSFNRLLSMNSKNQDTVSAVVNMHHYDSINHYNLDITTSSSTALLQALKIILASGGYPYVFGDIGCGKSHFLRTILNGFTQNSKEIMRVKSDVLNRYLDTVLSCTGNKNGKITSQIFDAFVDVKSKENESDNGLRHLMQHKMLPFIATSLNVMDGANGLRKWIKGELATNMPNKYEFANGNSGLIYIDDMHLSQKAYQTSAGCVEIANNPLEFIKGIIDSNPAFKCKRSLSSNATDASTETLHSQVIHDDVVIDPKQIINSKRKNLDLTVNTLGVLLSGRGYNTGSFHQSIQCILKNVSLYCYPAMNAEEWEITLFAAAMQSIVSTEPDKSQLIVAYKNDIYDLCKVTATIVDKIVTYFDSDKLSLIEKKLRNLMTHSVNLASKIASGLAYGADKISEGGGLVQLFSKEWKSHFVDPLPDGYQKKRICNLLREELSHLDTKRWSITPEWVLKLGAEYENVECRQWVNPQILQGNSEGGNKFRLGSFLNKVKHADNRRQYTPIKYLTSSQKNIKSTVPVLMKTKGKMPLPNFNKSKEAKVIDLQSYSWSSNIFQLLYPAAVSFALRIVAIISSNIDNKNVLIQGYQCSSRLHILCLAATIADCKVSVYYPKGNRLHAALGTADAHKLINLLKCVVLGAIGLKYDPLSEERKKVNSFIQYEVTTPKSQALVLASIEEFSVEEKKIIVQFLEFHDPLFLFDENELIGLVDAVLKLKNNDAANHAPAADNYDILSHKLSFVSCHTTPFLRQYIMQCITLRVVVLIENNITRAMPLRDSTIHKDFKALYSENNSSKENVVHEALFSEIVNYDIMQCKELGSLIQNQFTAIWHVEDSISCLNGVCHATFGDHKEECIITLKKLDVNALSIQTSGAYLKDDDDDDDYVNPLDGGQKVETNNKNNELLTGDLRLHIKWPRPPTNHFVGIKHVGILNSFISQTHRDISYSTTYMNDLLRVCMNEARLILPHVMSIHAPCDAFFAKEQVVLPSTQMINERASNMVKQLLEETTSVICNRKQELELALKVIQESLYVVNNIPEVRSSSQQNIAILNEEILRVNDSINQSSEAFKTFQNNFAKAPESEAHSMLQEDLLSADYEFNAFAHYLNSVLSTHKNSINELDINHWNNFVHAFGAKPMPQYLTLIKAIVILTNFTPQNITKEAILRMDEKLLCRIAISMIRKPDFIETLVSINPFMLSPHHISLLKQVNNYLWSENTPHTFPDTTTVTFSSTLVADGMTCPAFDTLKNYLLVLELFHASHSKYVSMENSLKAKSREFELLDLEYNNGVAVKTEQYRGFKNELVDQFQNLEAMLIKNKSQVEAINVLEEIREDCVLHLQHFRDYMKKELNKLKEISRYSVADACVIAAVLTRAGFLPEQIRQECMDTFRQALRNLGHNDVSDSPFLLGCFSDMNQFRKWTSHSNIARDPTAINSICLSLLTTHYSYIYDPDMMAMNMLHENIPDGFHWYHVSAREFSLNSLHAYVKSLAATLNQNSGIFLVISELEVGVSDDLVTFLSEDYVHTSISTGEVKPSHASSCLNDDPVEFVTIKVTLISQVMPCLRPVVECDDRLHQNIMCHPLPACCLRNVSIIHWISSSPSPIFDSKVFNTQLQKNYVEDYSIQAHFLHAFTTTLLPHHRTEYTQIKSSILAAYNDIQRCYETFTSQIILWNGSNGVSTGSISNINNIFLGICGSSKVRRSIEALYKDIQSLQAKLQQLQEDEDNISLYESALHNIFGSSSDFIRMCKLMIPVKLFIPFTFASDIITARCIPPIQSTLLKSKIHLPASLQELQRINRGVTRLQQTYRRFRLNGQGTYIDNKVTVDKINALLHPVSQVCLRSVIEYISSCVSPGHEYLVRFCTLLFFSMNKNISLYPMDELRLYSQLILPRMCHVPMLAVSYYVSISSNNTDFLAQLSSSLVEVREEKRRLQVYTQQADSANCLAGLLINLYSPRWTYAVPLHENDSTTQCGGAYRLLNNDINTGARLNLRNSKFHPLPRMGDIFNLELFHCFKVQSFSVDNVNSIVGLGADDRLIELIMSTSSGLMRKMLKEALKLKQLDTSKRNVGRKQRVDTTAEYVSDVNSLHDSLVIKQQKANNKMQSNFFVNQKENVVVENDDKRGIIRRISILKTKQAATEIAATNLIQLTLLEVETTESLEHHHGAYHKRLHKMLYNTHGINRFNAHMTTIDLKRELRVDRSQKTLLDFIPSPVQWTLLDMLEKHSAFSNVFRSLKRAISESLTEFLLWKDILEYLIRHNITGSSIAELDEILCLVIPPLFDYPKGEMKRSEGLWAQGCELSILQTIIFTDIIVPGASKYIIQLYLSLLAVYFHNGGKLSSHSRSKKTERYSDDDDDDEEDDDKDEDEENTDDKEPSSSNRIGALEDNIKWQEGLSYINNWSYLRRYIAANEQNITRKLPKFHTSGMSAEQFLSFMLSAEYSLDAVYLNYNHYLSLHGDDQSCIYYTEQPFGSKFMNYQLRRSQYDHNQHAVPLRLLNIRHLYTNDRICGNAGDELASLKKELQQVTTRKLIHILQTGNNEVNFSIYEGILERTPCNPREIKASTKNMFTLVVSASHGNRGSYTSRLPQSLSKIKSYWLPSVTCKLAVYHVNGLHHSVFMAPSLSESTALLADELENSLLSIVTQQIEIAESNLALRDRYELLSTNKIVVRIVAGIITIWRLCYYHFAALIGNGEGLEWFYSYEQLTMSQYMTIFTKIKALLATNFGKILSPTELQSLPHIVSNHLFHTLTNYDEILLSSFRVHSTSNCHDMVNKEFTLMSRVYVAAIISKTHNLWRVGLSFGNLKKDGAAFVIQPTQFGKILDSNSFMLGKLSSNQIIQGLLVWTYDGLDHIQNEKRSSYKALVKLQHAIKRYLLTKKFTS